MKVIVADKISERGVELLRKAGWNIVLTDQGHLERGDSGRGRADCEERDESYGGIAG